MEATPGVICWVVGWGVKVKLIVSGLISPETVEKFDTRDLIFTMPFVLFGIFRYLYLTYQLPDRLNPTEAVIRDAPSLLNMLLWGLVVLGTIYFA